MQCFLNRLLRRRNRRTAVLNAWGGWGIVLLDHWEGHLNVDPLLESVDLVRLDAGADEENKMNDEQEDGEGQESICHRDNTLEFIPDEIIVVVGIVSIVPFVGGIDGTNDEGSDCDEPDDQVEGDMGTRMN